MDRSSTKDRALEREPLFDFQNQEVSLRRRENALARLLFLFQMIRYEGYKTRKGIKVNQIS